MPAGRPHTLYPQIGLAKMHLSLVRHTATEPRLLDAAEQCERSEASRRMHWQSTLNWLIELYDAWHAADPDKGYDQKAAKWRAKLPASEQAASLIKGMWRTMITPSTSQPASQPADS